MKTKNSITKAFLLSVACAALALASCTEKPQSKDIITKKPVKAAPKPTQDMGDYRQERSVEWLGGKYGVSVERKADKSLGLALDESGNKYFDNRITLTIKRSDGSEFFNRTFSKADFASYVGEEYRDGALLGIVFDHVDGDNIYFAASVGSPDRMSDNYVPLVLKISRVGGVSILKDTQLDTASDTQPGGDMADDDEDGV